MSPLIRGRLIVLVVLFSLLFALFVGYGSLPTNTEVWNLPDGADLTKDYQQYLGSPVRVTGEVVEMDPVVIEGHYVDGKQAQFRIQGRTPAVKLGETLTIYGVAEEGHVIQSRSVISRAPTDIRYMLAVSVIAALWVLARLVRGWRFDWGGWEIEPRDEKLSVEQLREWARSTFGGGRRSDA